MSQPTEVRIESAESIQPSTTEFFEIPKIDRRDALKLIGFGTLFGAGAVYAYKELDRIGLFNTSKDIPAGLPRSAYDSSDREHYPDQLTGVVGAGLEEKWQKVAVFPGMFLALPGAKFYKDVMLTKEVDLGITGDNRALIVRPAFPGSSLAMGTGAEYSGEDYKAIQAGGIDSDTFAFISPVTGAVVFGNYSQSIEALQIHSRLQGDELAYTSETSSNLPLQFIDIATRKPESGVIVPVFKGKPYEKPELIENENGGREVVGHRMAQPYYALAQGRVYETLSTVNYLLDQFYGNKDVIKIEPDVIGSLVPLPQK